MTDAAMDADVLVVGAGPAGSTAARFLARAGRQVILVESKSLPRHKTCAGGVPLRALQQLDLSIDGEVLGTVSSVSLDGGFGGRISMPVSMDDGVGAVVVDRASFDAFLVKEAQRSGAILKESWQALRMEKKSDGWLVASRKEELRVAAVVLADGATSPMSRQLGWPRNRLGYCLEALVQMKADLSPGARSQAVFHLGCLRDGYAWSFPRGDVFSIGIGSTAPKDTGLEIRLRTFIKKTPELDGSEIQAMYGGMIPDFDTGRTVYAREQVYAVGDAAALVDPLTGEGIHWAIQSGRLAAGAVLAGGEEQYHQELERAILPELRIAARYARTFRKTPTWLRRAGMALPAFKRRAHKFVQLLTGQIRYAGPDSGQTGERTP